MGKPTANICTMYSTSNFMFSLANEKYVLVVKYKYKLNLTFLTLNTTPQCDSLWCLLYPLLCTEIFQTNMYIKHELFIVVWNVIFLIELIIVSNFRSCPSNSAGSTWWTWAQGARKPTSKDLSRNSNHEKTWPSKCGQISRSSWRSWRWQSIHG